MSRKSLVVLLALAVLHAGLALTFASLTPYRTAGIVLISRGSPAPDIGAPDERQHVNYIAHLATGKGLPVFDVRGSDRGETYEYHQPPAYYAAAAVFTKLIGVTDFTSTSAGVAVRSFNSLVGALTVVAVFFLGWWGFRDEATGLLAAAVAAFLPMNVALSGAASNDPLLLCAATWALAVLVHGVRNGWTTKGALAIGSLAGLAILTKTTGVALLPVLLLALFVGRTNRPSLKHVGLALVPLIIIVAPWWARNQSLYGDPLAIKVFNEAFTGNPQAAGMIQAIGPFGYWIEWVGWWTVRSFVGVFGYMDIWLTSTGLPQGVNSLYQVVLAVFVVGIVGWIVALRKADASERPVHILNAAFSIVVLFLFIRFNAQYFQAQGRYLLPAIGPIAVGVAVGLRTVLKSRPTVAAVAIVGLLLVTDLLAISRLPGEFARRTPPVGTIR